MEYIESYYTRYDIRIIEWQKPGKLKVICIYAPLEKGGLWDPDKNTWVNKREYEVIDLAVKSKTRETIYKKILTEEPLDFTGKYVKGFSLGKFRLDNDMNFYKRIILKDFKAIGTFFDGEADFMFTTFDGDASFRNASFGSGHYGAHFFYKGGGIINFRNLMAKGNLDMSGVRAKTIDFSKSLIYGTVNLTGIKTIDLFLTDTKITGKIFISSEELRLKDNSSREKDVINIQSITHREKRDQFRVLKENFRNLGQYDDEDKAYRWFIYHKIRDEVDFNYSNTVGSKIKKIIKNPSFPFKWLFYEQMGLYGTSPLRVVLTMAVVIVLFSIAYLPSTSLENIGLSKNLPLWVIGVINSIYHSIITFLTIGYGDNYIRPSLLGRALSGIEGFAGLFLMSYFTISFVRKVLR